MSSIRQHIRKLVDPLTCVALSGSVLAACSAPGAEDQASLGTVQEALDGSPANEDISGFEVASAWSADHGTVTVSAQSTEGSNSLEVVPSYFTTYTSDPMRYTGAPTQVGFDLWLPPDQQNPWWAGGVQMHIEVPSLSITNEAMGGVQLDGLARGQWHTLSFEVPPAIRSILDGQTYDDLVIKIALNVPNGDGPFRFDRLRGVGGHPTPGDFGSLVMHVSTTVVDETFSVTARGLEPGATAQLWYGLNESDLCDASLTSPCPDPSAAELFDTELAVSTSNADGVARFDVDLTSEGWYQPGAELSLQVVGELPSGMLSASESETLRVIEPEVTVPDQRLLFQDDSEATIEEGDAYGTVLATGDFDGDGHDDVAIGSPNEDDDGATDCGFVVVHYGGSNGMLSGSWERFTQNSVVTQTNEDGDHFGSALAVADFNADGYDDLAIGVPGEDTDGAVDTGIVGIMYGSANGLLPSNTESITQNPIVTQTNEDGDGFGSALAAGDFDDDGFGDLAVGIPFEDTAGGVVDSGLIGILYGSNDGLLPANSESISQDSIVTAVPEDGDRFGSALTAADFNGDGHDDLAVGAPYESVGGVDEAGILGILYGSDAGLLPSNSESISQNSVVTATNEVGDRFGHTLAAGDVDGDGYADLVVGVPYENRDGDADVGMVAVLYGHGGGLLPSSSEAFTQGIVSNGEREDGDRFGFALSVADFDADGHDDIIVGSPGENVVSDENGLIMTFFGSDSGVLPNPRAYWLSQGDFGRDEGEGDQFGAALAAGDFDGDGELELAIGAPFEDAGSVQDAGGVLVTDLEPAMPNVDADSALVFDRWSGKAIAARRPDEIRPMASTTKMMTALLVTEAYHAGEFDLEDTTTISASSIAAGGSSAGLVQGDTWTISDLLIGLMLPSGNDAAVALAEVVDGTEADFADRMNARAAELGLNDTSFVYAHGRDPEDLNPICMGNDFGKPECAHFSTARDLSRLARYALGNSLFASIVRRGSAQTTTQVDGSGNPINYTNTNRLVRSTSASYRPNAYGVKTGTTGRAQACLVFAEDDGVKNVVGALLHAQDSDTRYTDANLILNFAFSN